MGLFTTKNATWQPPQAPELRATEAGLRDLTTTIRRDSILGTTWSQGGLLIPGSNYIAPVKTKKRVGIYSSFEHWSGTFGSGYDATYDWPYYTGGGTGDTMTPVAVNSGLSMNLATRLDLLPELQTAVAHVTMATSSTRHNVGLLSGFSYLPDGAYFRSDEGGNWFAVCRTGGSETTVDTGVAASTAPMAFKVTVVSERLIRFSIQDRGVASIEDDLPVSTTLTPLMWYGDFSTTGTLITCRWNHWMGLSHLTRGPE